MTPADVVAACDARQREVAQQLADDLTEPPNSPYNLPPGRAQQMHDADLAVVALVRGVAERHKPYTKGRDRHMSYPPIICTHDECEWPCPDFERAAAVADGWRG